jgi:nucleoid-associated protein YgaU
VSKLNIKPLEPSKLKDFDVQFNPSQYTIVKPVSWEANRPPDITTAGTNRELDAPILNFKGGGSRTLTLRLFFDVTEKGPDADVRDETNKLVQLTRIEPVAGTKKGKPPICRITWGKQPAEKTDFPYDGVVTSLTQTFVFFRNSGEPVRANVDVTFLESIDAVDNKKETDPDFTTHIVKRGDTLSAIAARQYRDPALWRVIAAANGIDDPRALKIGVRLSIPALSIPR